MGGDSLAQGSVLRQGLATMKRLFTFALLALPLLLEGPGETFYDVVVGETYVLVARPHGSPGCIVLTSVENTGLRIGSWGTAE
jgi:hypothetical protein